MTCFNFEWVELAAITLLGALIMMTVAGAVLAVYHGNKYDGPDGNGML